MAGTARLAALGILGHHEALAEHLAHVADDGGTGIVHIEAIHPLQRQIAGQVGTPRAAQYGALASGVHQDQQLAGLAAKAFHMAAIQPVTGRLLQQPVAGLVQPDTGSNGHLVARPHQPYAGIGGATAEPAPLIHILQPCPRHQRFGEGEHMITVEIGKQQNAGHRDLGRWR